jgi:hypothetical protein
MVVAKPSPAHAGRFFEAISLGHVSGLVLCSREPSGVRQGERVRTDHVSSKE